MAGKSLTATISWIGADCGGRKHPAFAGMRPNVRWQRHIREWLHGSWDAEIVELDEGRGETEAILSFSDQAEFPSDLDILGELFELLDGYRVIGVGKITGVVTE